LRGASGTGIPGARTNIFQRFIAVAPKKKLIGPLLARLRSLARELRSLARYAFGFPDPWGDFRRLVRVIHPGTWQRQQQVYDWLDAQAARTRAEDPATFAESDDLVVRRGWELRQKVLAGFRDKLAGRTADLRVLVFTPAYTATAAGYSLFRNLVEGFAYLGLPARSWHQGEPLEPHLREFSPTLLLANDPETYNPNCYLENFNWTALRDYRKTRQLRIGLVATPYPKAPDTWAVRLAHARRLGVDFFYSFQAPEFISRHHSVYRSHGFPVLSLEFGANPLVYYPVPTVERDLDYVFLGSAHFEKWERYYRFFRNVMAQRRGLVCGPFWPNAARTRIDESLHRYLYARARVGLNLHVPFQIDDATELNERAYNLAACGVPQLTDAPKLLLERFRPQSVFFGATPTEYHEQFLRILICADEARERAINALEDVFTRHTVFHRVESFVAQFDALGSATANR
jgi:hypothetical protein